LNPWHGRNHINRNVTESDAFVNLADERKHCHQILSDRAVSITAGRDQTDETVSNVFGKQYAQRECRFHVPASHRCEEPKFCADVLFADSVVSCARLARSLGLSLTTGCPSEQGKKHAMMF
jgi:hypothetical protein